jgi:MoxR-like ATPase
VRTVKAECEAIVSELRRLGYVADLDIASGLFLADKLKKPLLIEGEAGVGKTDVARVLAKLKNTQLVRLQCYEGLDFSAALYEWNYQKQIVSLRVSELKSSSSVSVNDVYSEEYLLQRPILRALLAPQSVVLLLDEVDRADEEFEALLLETLADYQLTIPELGTLRARHVPYVILTSNRTRELTDALRRRCLYLWIGYPSFEKELAVIQLNVPEMEPALAMKVTSFVQALRREKLNKPPGLSEAVDWAQALRQGGVRILDRASVDFTAGCLLKDYEDIRLFKSTLAGPLMESIGGAGGH